MKARWFYALLAVISLTGVLIEGFVAHSEASSATAQASVVQHDASAFSAPF
jgi:hypothetical protein